MLSLVTAFIENVRVITSEAYVTMASSPAIEMIFGDYNKELYDEYGLFAYGGYNGIGISDFEYSLLEIINKNLEFKPEDSLKTYSNLYRLKDISCEADIYYTLDEDKVFLGQISDYIITSVVDNIKEYVNQDRDSSFSMNGTLDEAIKYEDGAYDTDNSGDGNINGYINGENKDKPSEKEIDEKLKSDSAGGNPLKALKNIINNGMLSLVCDVSKVSETKIEAAGEGFNSKEKDDDNSSAAKLLKSLLEGDDSQELNQDKLMEQASSESSADKLEYIYYADKVLASYVDSDYKTVHYGLEYLVAGKETEKENLAYVVRQLLIIRTLVNMAYVSTNTLFQSKSLATATAIVGFTGIAPLITATQWLILTILAFEEACIDVTALLAGKKVPLIKSPADFKMKYEEICSVSYSFFKRKGKSYKKADEGNISSSISYKQYLLLLQILVPKQKLKNRIIDIIQFDLRKRVNQTFEFRECICAALCNINYNIPYAYSYIKTGLFSKIKTNQSGRCITVGYGYVKDLWK